MKTYDISTATVNKYHSSLHNLTSLEIDYTASGLTASDNWTIQNGQSTSSGSFETYADQFFFAYCLPGQVAINGQPVKITGIKALADKVNRAMIDPRQECSL